jgi:exo-beta-1,3-glucanase (GH17 family)
MSTPKVLSFPLLLLALTGSLASLACEGGHHKSSNGGAGTNGNPGGAGTTGAAGTDASGQAGTTGAAGTSDSGAAGTTGAAGTNASGQAGTTGAAGGGAGTTGASGSNGAAGNSGAAGMFPGPPAFSNKPLSVVAYSPFRDGQAPGGAQPTRDQVKQDLMMLKPLVDGVRVYGTDGANAFIPGLCDELGIDLHLGAWIDGIATDEANTRDLARIVNENHPRLKTAIVGNEVLARSAKNKVTEERLIELIKIAKSVITVKTVKIAAADTYPQWMMMRPNLANEVDLLIWHTYGYWSGVDIANAYSTVNSRYNDMLAAYPGKPMLLGETGWPTKVD